MPVRETLSELLERTVDTVRRALDDDRELPWEPRLNAMETVVAGMVTQLEELSEAHGKLEKRLSMTMGAVQAATSQLMELKESVRLAGNQAQQAMQRATSAQHAAESAADAASSQDDAE